MNTDFILIENPRLRVVEDLRIRNKDNMKNVAGEYFGSKFTYAETFQMFEDFKKAFIHVDGLEESAITISAPSTIASVKPVDKLIENVIEYAAKNVKNTSGK